jgi:hypothetical protein
VRPRPPGAARRPSPRRPDRRRFERRAASSIAAALLLLSIVSAGDAAAAGAPPLPIADDGKFLPSISLPTLAPGGTELLSFQLSNPMGTTLANLSLSFEFYAFNPAPGTGAGPLPSSAPGFAQTNGSWGPNATFPLPSLAGGASLALSDAVRAPPSAPEGTYAVRTSLTFVANGTGYRLWSAGHFAPALWSSATTGPNGTSVLNLSRLGVSGVLPETALEVRSPALSYALYAILGAAVVLAAVGGYWAGRRGPGSRSGAKRAPPAESQAPSALGKRRTRDGD